VTQTASRPRQHQLKISGYEELKTPRQAAHVAAAGPVDFLPEVWRAGSYLESIQWELDAAQESLSRAVLKAAASGADHGQLCKAANITREELEDILLHAERPADPAASWLPAS
jgi:hypothetical protein